MEIHVKSNQAEEIEGLSVEYPYVLHRVDLSETRVPWHWHEEVEFVLVRRGGMRLCTIGKTWEFGRGEGFFINTDVICCMEQTESCRIDSHLMHGAFLGGHFKSVFETKYLDPILKNHNLEIIELRGNNENQIKILDRLKKAAALQDEPDTEFQTRNIFSEIWLLLLSEAEKAEYARPAAQSAYQERLQTMISFIQQNFAEKISLKDIADSALISEREALRCFQSCIEKSPVEYLMEYRIEMSKKLLKETDMPVSGAAYASGFSNAAYFGKIFKRSTGMTPGAYKKSCTQTAH